MQSALADFIEHHAETILEDAIRFAKTIDVGSPLDETALRDHLPEILQAIVADLRTTQTRAEEIEKSEGRAPARDGRPRSAAGTHALHRAHSGYGISSLVSEYRALRASVLRLWSEAADRTPASLVEVARSNEAVDEAIAQSVGYYAEEIERWRNIFLGVLGHDLRSPLSAIVMTSELIARMAVDAPIATAAQRLIRNGEHMRALLDKLLVYNRAQMGGHFDVEKTDIDLANTCREEMELLQAAMPQARLHFHTPESVRGRFDAGRIREALANMVVNAEKYGTSGTEIHVLLQEIGTRVELSVSNAGQSIPGETLELMFDPLRRGGLSGGDSERLSLGLGLFIVRQIAQAHGGVVRVESDNGSTTFRLQMPRS
jgi:signal transduction histidine kinase